MTRRLVLLASVALALLGTAAATPASAGPARRALPPERPTKVLVLGDSVMKGAVTQVPQRLAGRDVVVDAEVNRSTGQAADILASLGSDWDVVVILIAHNDGGSPGAYQPAARRMVEQLRDVPRVSFLTIHEVRPYYPTVNAYYRDLAQEFPNVEVGDWNAVASAHPEGLASDGLHLNGTGATLLADVVAEQVEAAEADHLAALAALAAATTTTTAPPTTTTTTTAPPTTTTTSTSTTTTTSAPTTTTEAQMEAAPVAEVPGDPPGGSSTLGWVAAGIAAVVAVAGWYWARRQDGPSAG